MGQQSKKMVFNSVVNLRRMTYFWLCLLKTQVSGIWLKTQKKIKVSQMLILLGEG